MPQIRSNGSAAGPHSKQRAIYPVVPGYQLVDLFTEEMYRESGRAAALPDKKTIARECARRFGMVAKDILVKILGGEQGKPKFVCIYLRYES